MPDDLASEWLTGRATDARPTPPEATSATPSLASEWLTVNDKVPRITVTAKKPEDETPTEAAVRLIKEHQGDNWSDRAVRVGAGALQGIGDVTDTIAQGLAWGGQKGASALERVNVLSPEKAAAVRDWASGINADVKSGNALFNEAAADSPAAQAGRIGGQIVATAPVTGPLGAVGRAVGLAGRPIANALVGGAASGAGAAALTSSTSEDSLGSQVLTGGGLGAAVGPAGYAASAAGRGIRNALFGHIDPATARLALDARTTYGIPVTAGQMSNTPFVRFADSVLQRLPFTGYGARTAQQGAAMNREVANAFGEVTDAITPTTIRAARTRIGADFDQVAARTGNIQVDHPFVADLQRIGRDAASVLPRSEIQPLNNQMRNIVDTIDPATGSISARSYQALTRKGAPLERAQQSADPNVRFYASQVREALDDVMGRSAPPDVQALLRQARSQWKAMKTIEPLADKATTHGISPALLMGAVNKSYPGGGGNALRDLAQIGQRFIKEPPSSGTSERLLMLHGLGLGAGAIGAAAFDPENMQRDLALGGLALAAGRGGSAALRSNWLANALIHSPLPPAGNALTAIANRAGPAAALTFRDRSAGQ